MHNNDEDELKPDPTADRKEKAPRPQSQTPSVRSIENQMSRTTVQSMRDRYELD